MSEIPTILRWIARLSALVIAGGYVYLVAGEMLSPHSAPPTKLIEWTGIALLSATCIGMLLAWRWELPGAVLSLGALIAFSLLIKMGHHTVLFVFALPGSLFLADWLVRRVPRIMSHKS
jgi:hypothetical protein